MARIEIDGKTFEAENGKMIIEVADDVGIHIPRFCYHKKLSIAANCRMCLVEVEGGRKTLPACATPIADGMKILTKSAEAIRSQQAVMEFLLINHPLDCPICDQGGECELQDVSMGFGYDESEYREEKRAVSDDNLGTLIATEMTRCIHCTRCVRFGQEVAGMRELGALGRGEKMQISTFVQHSMCSEISGNIIDLCPVGALTSKPYRFQARSWELTQHASIAPHDCLGSNVYLHVRRNQLLRVVPKDNESINETWLSDRDRFSYLGLNDNRAGQPMIKKQGNWQVVDWPTALKYTAEKIAYIVKTYGAEQFAAFVSPSSTLEECYLLQKLMRALGINNLDHRLQQTDFRDAQNNLNFNANKLAYNQIDMQDNILLIGLNINREVPLAGARVRKAQRRGAQVFAINAVDYDVHFTMTGKSIVSPLMMPEQLAKIIFALVDGNDNELPTELRALVANLTPDDVHNIIAQALKKPKAVILTGAVFTNHPDAAIMRTLIKAIVTITGARIIQFSNGANTAGAEIAGMLPHTTVGKKVAATIGLDIQTAFEQSLKGYLLLGIEPEFDFANPASARQSIKKAEFVVSLSAINKPSVTDYADVILPIAPYAETSGTYINVDDIWQTVEGVCKPYEASRPAWKVLRVLANLLNCDDFDYISTASVLAEIKTCLNQVVGNAADNKPYYPLALPAINKSQLTRVGEWPLYRCDAIVRNAKDLQACAAADVACIKINPVTAEQLKLDDLITVSQGDIEVTLPLIFDDRVAANVVWVSNALPETIDLGHSFAAITIRRP